MSMSALTQRRWQHCCSLPVWIQPSQLRFSLHRLHMRKLTVTRDRRGMDPKHLRRPFSSPALRGPKMFSHHRSGKAVRPPRMTRASTDLTYSTFVPSMLQRRVCHALVLACQGSHQDQYRSLPRLAIIGELGAVAVVWQLKQGDHFPLCRVTAYPII